MDFTFSKLIMLLKTIKKNYDILPYYQYLNSNNKKVVVLRHDVDRYPKHSLKVAKIEADLGISSTFYFRTIRSVFKPKK